MKNKIIVFGLFLGGLSFISCNGNKEEEKPPVRPVSVQEVGFLGGESTRTFTGTASTDKVINLSFRNTGIITVFDLKIGQKVKKQELLAKLDNVQSRLNYENSLSSLNSAQSQMNTAKLSLDRVRSLYEKGSTSLSDYEGAKNQYRTAAETYESAKRTVAIQQEQIRYGYIYAPENGVIAAVNAEIDENVTAGQNIAVLNAGRAMKIELGIPENIINRVAKDMTVSIAMSSLPGEFFAGAVTEVSPSVDPNTSTYPVSVIITDPPSEIKSGMAANVTFEFGSLDGGVRTLVVPAKAVGEDATGNFVFLIEDADGKSIAKKQYVTVGDLSSEGFSIEKGLLAGQNIAIAGLQTLLNGQEVKLQ